MGVNEPSGERDNKVEVEGSKETELELLKRPRPAKAPTRPTAPMRSKSMRGTSAETISRRMRAMRVRRDQGGRRGVVVIVEVAAYEGARRSV
jgi:hypothetical protein